MADAGSTGPSARVLRVSDLGRISYEQALLLQRSLREQRIAGATPDTLLLLEHPPVFTTGRGSVPEEFLVPPGLLEAQGFGIYKVERGGKTTYHGPGQLVGYPIISLADRGLGVREYISRLEDCLIAALAQMGLVCGRRAGLPGVWIADRKIAALGVHVSHGVTMHGFALNIHPDLSHFSYIVPCGIEDATVTSVHAELDKSPSMAEAKAIVEDCFRAAFGY